MQDQPVALIVNSNQRQIEQLRSVLADESLDVLVSSNFRAALERVERIPIDTLITPLHTGLLDGLKVLEIARLANPDVGAVFQNWFGTGRTCLSTLRVGPCLSG